MIKHFNGGLSFNQTIFLGARLFRDVSVTLMTVMVMMIE